MSHDSWCNTGGQFNLYPHPFALNPDLPLPQLLTLLEMQLSPSGRSASGPRQPASGSDGQSSLGRLLANDGNFDLLDFAEDLEDEDEDGAFWAELAQQDHRGAMHSSQRPPPREPSQARERPGFLERLRQRLSRRSSNEDSSGNPTR
eukprot:scaffold180457_cov42-Prasinocladus_malaysianus.AAC.1